MRDMIVIVLIVIVVALYGVLLYLENVSTHKGITLQKLEEQVRVWKIENQLLKEQILQAQALTTLKEKAIQRGFIEAEYYRL